MRSARPLYQRAVDLAVRRGHKEIAARFLAWEAYAEAEFGNPRLAREQATAAVAIARARDAMSVAACALARSGAQPQADALINELARRFPTHTLLNAVWLPAARARIPLRPRCS